MEDDMNIEFKTCYNKELIIRKSYNKESAIDKCHQDTK